MDMPILQAHRGVSSDYPENTMSAFRGAVYQGYGIIELDPAVTADGEIVVLHDSAINRTGRTKNFKTIEEEIFISDITYKEALEYDFGAWFSNKFKGEKIPLLAEVLSLAKENNLLVKIDNKFRKFTDEQLDRLFEIAEESGAKIAFTCNDTKFIPTVTKRMPDAEIHYDGIVTEEILEGLSAAVKREKLVVWLPYKTPLNAWVKTDFANENFCGLVKKYSRLGLWILSEYSEYDNAIQKFAPDIIETTGKIKPELRKGMIADIHTHSQHSHDSDCRIIDMAESEKKRGVDIFTVTDHCDVEYFQTINLSKSVSASHIDAKTKNEQTDGIEILSGTEIGEGFWCKAITENIISENPCDLVIGSVHAVKYKDLEMPYSLIDFGKMGKEKACDYFDKYLDDVLCMLKETELDVMAHLTCPLRYMNGKYGLGIDCKLYKEKIEKILKYIIKHSVALEVNTSCKESGYDEFMPEEWIIKMYADLGGYLITRRSLVQIQPPQPFKKP